MLHIDRSHSLIGLAFAASGLLHSESLVITPKTVKLLQVQGGPLASMTITIRSGSQTTQNWTATAMPSDPNDPWLTLSRASGTTPGSLMVGIVNWRGEQRGPGAYHGRIAIKTNDDNEVLPVDWEVRAANPPPAFSYLSGPTGCNKADGYADPPICTPLRVPEFAGSPTAGTAYVDPNFGARVTVVTGAPVYHTYATPSPLSAHNKYLMTFPSNGTWDIVEAATGKVAFKRVSSTQNFMWDASDDLIYYYYQGASIMKHDLRSNKDAVLVDYSRQPEHFRKIIRGSTGDTSKDNWATFWAPDEKQICAVDLNQVKTYCTDFSASEGKLPYHDIDFSLISKGIDRQSGKRYVILVAAPAMGVFSVDTANGTLKLEFRGPEFPESKGSGNHDGICNPGERCLTGSHLDTMEDSAGIQYFVMNDETSSPCEFSLSTYQLNKGRDILKQVELGGGRRKVMTLWRCGPGWVDEHVGCAKSAPYCVISTQSPPRNSSDRSPKVPTPHAGEIIVMRENGVEIRRLALSRSEIFTDNDDNKYWSSPRAAMSNDGSLVISDSNFGELNGQRVTLIQTGFSPKPK